MFYHKVIAIFYPVLFRILYFRRFRARYCRFGPGQVKLGSNSMVANGTIVKILPGGQLDIGEDCYVGEYANIRCDRKITIGNNVHIGQFVTMADADYSFGSRINFSKRNISEIVIGQNSFIGSHCCILRGANIAENSVIPAMTKLTR